MEDFKALLKRLSEAFGPSGFEDEVRGIVIEEMGSYVDEVFVDRWGNVYGVKKGRTDYRAIAPFGPHVPFGRRPHSRGRSRPSGRGTRPSAPRQGAPFPHHMSSDFEGDILISTRRMTISARRHMVDSTRNYGRRLALYAASADARRYG